MTDTTTAGIGGDQQPGMLPVVEWGQGQPTLVFLHYFGGAAVSWQWVAQQLASEFRCVAIDLPGFGSTPPLAEASLANYAQAVNQTLDTLAIANNYLLIGHSMGGKLALQVALERDCLPQHIVLVAPSPPTQEPMPAAEKQRLLDHHPSREQAETTLHNATRQPLSDTQRSVALATHMAVAASAWRWWLLEGMTHSLADRLTNWQTPVTVLASEDDPVIPFDTMQTEVLQRIPRSHLVATAGVGHLLPLEAADWVAAQIRAIAMMATGRSLSPI